MNGEAQFAAYFQKAPQYRFSAPGRTELGGNHTDHQHGCALAASVHLELTAWVGENKTTEIHLQSEGFPACRVDLRDLAVQKAEIGTTAALIRGVAAGFAARGETMHGMDIYCRSSVLSGSGLSSSAAFEVMLATVFNRIFCGGKYDAVEIAKIAQTAERDYFGKPCGLLDQTACAVGGIVGLDFQNPQKPKIERIAFDFDTCGYALCIINTHSDHADLTDAYAAIPNEMRLVAAQFGKEVLRETDEAAFYRDLSAVRAKCGDRAVLRAMHFFAENRRVGREIDALRRGDFAAFLEEARASGHSSWELLQNITPPQSEQQQSAAFTLALCEKLLGDRGAARIHGGGFGGTVQAFVPQDRCGAFCEEIDRVLGAGSCIPLRVRPQGGILEEIY